MTRPPFRDSIPFYYIEDGIVLYKAISTALSHDDGPVVDKACSVETYSRKCTALATLPTSMRFAIVYRRRGVRIEVSRDFAWSAGAVDGPSGGRGFLRAHALGRRTTDKEPVEQKTGVREE